MKYNNKNLETLDKYYTKKQCAQKIINIVHELFPNVRKFIEPSAGAGNISKILMQKGFNVIAYDIIPDDTSIIKANYLTLKIPTKNHITIGNPPFGYKGAKAVSFLNKALRESIAVAFIMPITATRFSLQNQVNKRAKLIYQISLPNNSFELPDKSDYSCNTVFQIWTLQNYNFKNIREKKPRIKHKDFLLYRHNATKQTKKYIDFDWDFAVYAQGYKDYKNIFTQKDKGFILKSLNNSNDQFYFIKAKNKHALRILKNINYHKLAYTNHIIPGFCKNDIIKAYEVYYENTKRI